MKKESFIDEIVGNIKDTIKNITYSLQRYSDEFVNYMTLSYKSLKEYNFNDDIVCFLMCESESILKNKILQTSVEMCNFLHTKHQNLQNKLYENNMMDEFYVPSILLEEFKKKYSNTKYYYNTYHKELSDKEDDIYDFISFYNKELERIENESKKITEDMYSLHNTNIYIHEVYECFRKSMMSMKACIESSTSCYQSALIIKDMISCVIDIYSYISMIRFKEN